MTEQTPPTSQEATDHIFGKNLDPNQKGEATQLRWDEDAQVFFDMLGNTFDDHAVLDVSEQYSHIEGLNHLGWFTVTAEQYNEIERLQTARRAKNEVNEEHKTLSATQALADMVPDYRALTRPRVADVDHHIKSAKGAVQNVLAEAGAIVDLDEIYVVWFSKTLQNWKACLSTIYTDGIYFEATFNGDKHEIYVDTYHKVSNHVVHHSE
jgi:hypothetical protein